MARRKQELSDDQRDEALANLGSMEEEVRDKRRDIANCPDCAGCGFRPADSRWLDTEAYPTVRKCTCQIPWALAGRTYLATLGRLELEVPQGLDWLFELPQPASGERASDEKIAWAKREIAKMAAGMWDKSEMEEIW